MGVRNNILDKLNHLQSIAPSGGDTFFSPVVAAVNAYYDACSSYVHNVNDCIDMLSVDIYRRNVHYEHEFDKKMPTNFPTGYYDLWECFYKGEEIVSISDSAFNGAWYDDPVTMLIGGNTYLDTWLETLEQKQQIGSRLVDALTEWCKNSGGNSFLISKFEDRGKRLSFLSYPQIADIIYVERHLKDVMTDLQIDAFLPSYE